MNNKEYINRINYNGSLTPEFVVLKELQKSHLLNVPFENLDIHYGRPIELDIAKFYTKIVTEGRGGFCYELNGLFQNLLNNLGFKTTRVSARVYDHKKEEFGAEYDHLALIIDLGQDRYLVDVGFGEFAMEPLKIELNKVQKDIRGNFIIEKVNDDYIVSKIVEEAKNLEYKFTMKERALSEFQGMCTYHQTNPNSHFTPKKLISKPTDTGRITITGNTLKITESGIEKKNVTFQEEEYAEQLQKWFNISESKIKVD